MVNILVNIQKNFFFISFKIGFAFLNVLNVVFNRFGQFSNFADADQ